MTTMNKVLAQGIIDCVKAHEESFDHVGARMAMHNALEHEAMTGKISIPNYTTFYRMSLREACDKTAPEGLADPIYFLLNAYWNDAILWAQTTLEPTKEIKSMRKGFT